MQVLNTISTMSKKLTLVPGMQFGRFTVVHEAAPRRAKNGNAVRHVLCKCSCGAVKEVRLGSLTEGKTVSCGCFHKQQAGEQMKALAKTHGLSKTPVYQVWCGMKRRCFNPKDKRYKNYGARGISVHPLWVNDFAAFASHMGPRGSALTVERIDNDKGYEPGNVRWATHTEQARNRTSNHMHTIDGVTKCLAEWCEVLNEPWTTVKKRVAAGRDPFIRQRKRRIK